MIASKTVRMRRQAWVLACVIAAGAASAGESADEPRPLGEQREYDRAWGLSLRPPQGTRVLRRTADDYLMRIEDEDGTFRLFLSVKRLKRPLTITQVLDAWQEQISRVHPTTRQGGRRELKVADRPAGVVYADVPRTRGEGRMVLGHGYVQMAPDTFALLEIESPIEHRPMATATFEAVLSTLELGGIEQVEADRTAAAQRALELHEKLTPKALHASLIEEQIFRIVESEAGRSKGKDIGWMRVRQTVSERVEKRGVFVEVRARVFIEDQIYDSQAGYFVSDDRTYEDWSVKTTQRTNARAPRPSATRPRDRTSRPALDDPTPTTTETGIRTSGAIEVRIDSPGRGAQTFSLTPPPTAYLSQAEAWLLPQIVPPDQPVTYGFYWYSPNHQKLVYRTDQVVPALDRFTLISRPAPNDPELRATYRGDRTLIEKNLSPTRKLVPTTAEQLRRIWPEG